MIIVHGAGSGIAQEYIASETEEPILAISRETKISQSNVENIFISTLDELETCLKEINEKYIAWINFKTIKTDEIITKVTPDQLRNSFEINFLPNVIAVKTLTPKMIPSKTGSFIFIDSAKAWMGESGCLSYSSSKKSNAGLQKTAVKEFSRFGITFNTIFISYANTVMWTSLSPALQDKLLKEVPGKKIVDFHEINSTIRFLIKNRIVNGTNIFLDGGLTNI